MNWTVLVQPFYNSTKTWDGIFYMKEFASILHYIEHTSSYYLGYDPVTYLRPGPEVIILFSCSTQLSTKF